MIAPPVAEERLRKTVLVIEDEHQMRTLLVLMLEEAGWRVLEAADGSEATHVWKRECANVDLIIADVWLPGVSGPDLVSFLRKESQQVKALFVSGMNPEFNPHIKKLTRNAEVVAKPFSKKALVAAMERALVK